MRRQYERLNCPECGRSISAYVPHLADGSDVRIVKHNYLYDGYNGPVGVCPASDRLNGEYKASQALVKDLS